MDNLNEETQVTETETPTETNTETAPTNTEAKQDEVVTESKASKYAKLEKSFNELRSMNDRRFAEQQKQLKAYEERVKIFSPYEDALRQELEKKKRTDLEGLYQSDPLEAQRRMAEQIAQQQVAPYKQYVEKMMFEKTADDAVNYLKTTYGDDAFNTMQEPMGQILNEVIATQGQEVSDLLARNPDALFQMAVGRAYMTKVSEQKQQKQVGTANQQKALQFAKGTGRPVGNVPKNGTADLDSLSEAELLKLAYKDMK